jgi:peptidoglycan/LPS O-acetylase OafA/YrhL
MPSRSVRSVPVDILRGIAILLVIGRHAVMMPDYPGIREVVHAWRQIGWSGVDLFFVLSGFLVGGLIFAEIKTSGDFRAARFVQRRWLRTIPLYAIYVVYLFGFWKFEKGLFPISKYLRSNFVSLIPYLTFTQNYLRPRVDQTWSLAVEEHFYLALPLIVVAILSWRTARRAMNPYAIPAVFLAIAIACTMTRCVFNMHRPYNGQTHVARTHIRIDSLFFGVLIAYGWHFHREIVERIGRRRYLLVTLAVLMLSPFLFIEITEEPFAYTFGFVSLYIAYGLLLIAAITCSAESGLSGWIVRNPIGQWIATMGFYSYGVYIWHNDINLHLLGGLRDRGVLANLDPTLRWAIFEIVYIGLAFLAGWLSYRLVEGPMLNVRNRIWPSPVRSALTDERASTLPDRDDAVPEGSSRVVGQARPA